jgi:hypothetical protein
MPREDLSSDSEKKLFEVMKQAMKATVSLKGSTGDKISSKQRAGRIDRTTNSRSVEYSRDRLLPLTFFNQRSVFKRIPDDSSIKIIFIRNHIYY